jgi:hypothetical protein
LLYNLQCKDSGGEKKGSNPWKFEYPEDNPVLEKYPFNLGSVHGKRDYVS